MKRTVIPAALVLSTLQGASQTQAYLDANNVRALILNRNDMFWDPATGNAAYEVPKGSGKQANFVNSLWIGGLDAGNQLRMAAMTYRQKGFDFWPGPLDTLNATTDSAMSAAFDRVWKIDRQEIESFVNAWQTGSLTAGTYSVPGVIQTWPGNGNTALGFAKKLAPFVDADNDGVYNPMKGDYPELKGDQMVYYITNDNFNVHTETMGVPLGIEMHVTAYAYNCPQIIAAYPDLENTTFYHYRVINRSAFHYSHMMAGIFSDVDMGNFADDYIGCSPPDRLGYAYNAAATDNVYGAVPPVTSYQMLRGPLALPGDNADNDHDGMVDEVGEECLFSTFMYYCNNISQFPPATTNPSIALNYYNYLQAIWKDGNPLRGDSVGYYAGTPTVPATPFAYPGDPSVPSGWTEYAKSNPPGDRRLIIGNGPFVLPAGESFELEFSILTSFDSNTNGHRNIPLVKSKNASIAAFYKIADSLSCLSTGTITGMESLNQAQIGIFPNPAGALFSVRLPKNSATGAVRLYNSLGALALEVDAQQVSQPIDITGFPPGLYFLTVEIGRQTRVARLVKQ